MKKKYLSLFVSFLTVIFYGQCSHQFNMYDSFGDGWNGNAVDISVNGSTVISGATIATGSYNFVNFNASTGDVIDLTNWITGSWTNEVSWDITDGDGVIIASGLHLGTTGGATGFCPTCPSPPLQFLSAGGMTANSANLSWTPGGSETSWNIQYGISGFPVGTGNTVSATTNPFLLTGLNPSTCYDYYIQAVCSANDLSQWSGPFTFCTSCLTVTAPYTQDFSTGALPVCWSQSAITGDGWRFAGNPGYDAANNGRPSGTYAWIDFSATDAGTVMEMVPVDISALTSPQIEFDYFCNNSTNPTPPNILFVEANNGTNWVLIDSLQINSIAGWNPYAFSLIGYDVAGVVSIRFRGESGGATNDFYNDILVDNVHVREAPTCPSPLVSNFGVANLTSNSAELTWLSGGNETLWGIEWGLSGFPLGNGNGDTTTLFYGYPISGLTPTTNYDFYIQAICGAGDSSYWTGPYTFTTPCAAYFPPQIENFSTGFPPNACWDQAGDGDPGTGPSGIGVSNWTQDGFANSGTTGAVKVYLFSTGKKEWILSPQYDFSNGGPYQLEFDFGVFNVNSSSSGMMGSDDRVEILISRDGGTTWNGITNFDNNYITNPGGNHEILTLVNDSGLVQFAIWASDGIVDDLESIDIMIDNFAINAIPNCPQPLAILGSNITSDSASITWNAGGNETLWNIQWGSAGFTLGTGTIDTTNTTSYILSNLNPSSAYEFYVQAICGTGDSSIWSGPFSFSTNIQGPVGVNCTTGGGAGVIFTDDLESQGGWTGNFGTGTTTGVWNIKSGSTSSIGTGPNSAHSGNFYFYYETSGTNPTSGNIVSPLIDLSTASDDAELSFWIHAYGAEIGTLNLGVSNSLSGPFSTIFTTSGQIQTANNDPYQNVGINLSAYLGQQIYLQFDYTSGSSFTGDIAIDFIEVSSCISCPGVDPSLLSVSSVTTDTVNLNWLGTSNHNSWLVYLVPSGSSVSNTIPFFVTNDTVSLPVNPSTTYNYYVSGICTNGDTSLLAGPYSFTSAFQCPPNAQCFTYNTGDIPTEYGVSNAGQLSSCAGMVEAVIPAGFILDSIHTSYDMTAAGGAWMSEQRSWLYLPTLNIGESNITSGNGGTIAGTESYSRTANFMSGLNATDTIAIELHAGRTWGGSGCGTNYNKVDNQTWMVIAYYGTIPTCPQPNSLNLINVGSDSATLTWSTFATDSLWNTYIAPSGVSPNNSHLILSNNDTIILSGLSPSTTYDFYVQTICNAGDSSYLSGPINFTTNCAADSAPYFTDFDSGFPLCWSQESVSDMFDWTLNSGSTSSTSTGPSQDMSSNGNYMYIETSSPRTGGDNAILYSQSVDISTLAAAELRFFHHMYGATIADLTIEISDNGGQSYNPIFSKSGDQGNQWNEEIVSIAAYSGIVKFKITGTVGGSFTGDIAIDNFEVREGPQNDVGIILASLPSASTGCEVDSSIVTATIFNFGYLPQTGFNVEYSLNGTPTVETVFDTIQPGDSLLFIFTLPVDLTQDGSYSFDFTTNLPNDDNTGNDAFGTTLTYENYYTPIAPTVTDDTVCVNSYYPNGNVATLIASGPLGVDIDWFDISGNYIGTGDTMTTDTINTTTSIFVAYKELAPGNIGAVNNTFGGGGYYNFFTDGLLFDVYSDMTIDSVTIYPSDTGTVGIIIQSILGSTIFNGTYTINAPINTVSGHKVPIGVNIPAGLGYGMYISAISPGTLSLYRNTTNASYPYDYGNIASIISASTGSTDFYFFFYNWDISTISCYSDLEEAEIYVDNCTGIYGELISNFNIFPNPNNGEFEIKLSYIGENTSIEIIDLNGKLLYQNKLNNKTQFINVSSISRGIYLISLIENGRRKTKKLIIK